VKRTSRPPVPFAVPLVAAVAGSAAGLVWADTHISRSFAWGAAIFLALAVIDRKPARGLASLAAGIALAFAAMAGLRGAASPAAGFARTIGSPAAATLEGGVATRPRPHGREAWSAEVDGRVAVGESGGGPARVLVVGQGPPPEIGDRVRIEGALERVGGPRNPGEFDPRPWLARRGIFLRMEAGPGNSCEVTGRGSPLDPRRIAAATADWISQTLTNGLDPGGREAALIVGMTVGETRGIDPALEEKFRGTGTFHLFSVSGLHVGMVGMLGWVGLGALRVPRRVIAAVLIAALFYYALVTGWKPASVRAATMGAFVLAGLLAGRPAVLLNSLLAAGFIILLGNPAEIGNAGFQFSFSVVLALVLAAGPAGRIFARPFEVDPFIPRKLYGWREKFRSSVVGRLAPAVAVSVVAWAGSLVLTFWYFHLVSVVAVPANLVCVPLAFAAMGVAVLSLVTGAVWPALGVVFNNANWLVAWGLAGTVELFAAIPGGYFYAAPPDPRAPPASLTVLDAGAGGAALLQGGGANTLLDCGPRHRLEGTLLPFLHSRGINRPGKLVLTHGDAAHIGAAAGLLATAPPAAIFEPGTSDRSPTRRTLRKLAAGYGLNPLALMAGETFDILPGVPARVLYPPAGHDPRVADDGALVLAFELGGWRVLALSDAGPAAEAWMLANFPAAIPCDLLLKGQHDSGTAMLPGFARAASPRLAILASADFPPGASVPEETRDLLRSVGARVINLAESGAVTIGFRESVLEASAFLSRQTLTIRRAHDGSPRSD